jgi:hypothetical protein
MGFKKLFGYSSYYIPSEKEDDIDDEDIESIVLQRINRLRGVCTQLQLDTKMC